MASCSLDNPVHASVQATDGGTVTSPPKKLVFSRSGPNCLHALGHADSVRCFSIVHFLQSDVAFVEE